MRNGDVTVFGDNGGIVEVDETFIIRLTGLEEKRAFHHKMKVLAPVDHRSAAEMKGIVGKRVTYRPLASA